MLKNSCKKQRFKLLLSSIVCTILFITTIVGGLFLNQINASAAGGKVIIHYYTEEWDNPNIYYWNSLPENKEVKWPGKAMKAEDTKNWYTYTFNDTTKINFLINYKDEQTDDFSKKSGEYWYKNGKWTTKNPDQSTSGGGSTVIDPDETPQTARTDFRDETIYFLMTTRFYDGCPENNTRTSGDKDAKNPEDDPSWRGDFAGLIEKLDYIKALGFTAIWITPVVTNNKDNMGYDYHGYHAYDFSKVDPRYESDGASYQDLIDAVHAKGMKIIQDVVFNHTCNWGEKNLKQLDDPVYTVRNQIVMNGKGDDSTNPIYHHNGFCGSGDYDEYSCQNKTIADDCFDLETENPTVYNYIIDCYKDYIDMGVDAYRVDTVKHMSRLTLNSTIIPALNEEAKKIGNDDFYMYGEICTKGHDVWYRDHPPISTCFYTWKETGKWADCWTDDWATNEKLVEEHYTANLDKSSQPTSDNAFLKGNEYHEPDYSQNSGLGAIDFQMHWSFENAGSAYGKALGEDQYFNDSTWNVVYVDSHDYGPDFCYDKRYTGGTDTWAENLDLMFTFRGIPCIYYGSEIEFMKGCPIDKGTCARLNETGRAYYGEYLEGNVNATGFGEYTASGAVNDTLNSVLSQQIIRLNKIRRQVPALRKGQYSTEGCSGGMAFKRRYTDDTVDSFACVTISNSATFTGVPNGKYVDAITGDVKNVTNGTLTTNECSGQGNMRVYVLDNGSGISGKIGNDTKYLK